MLASRPVKRGFALFIFVVASLGSLNNVSAEGCPVCGRVVALRHTLPRVDLVTGEAAQICGDCNSLPTACFLCSLPVKSNMLNLPDGRVLCARDAKAVVLDESEAKRTCSEAQEALARVFSAVMQFPDTSVVITIVDKSHLDQRSSSASEFDFQCVTDRRYMGSHPVEQGKWKHVIGLLSARPKRSLAAGCAHELAHCWFKENVDSQRHLNHEALEAFCELISTKLTESQRYEDKPPAITFAMPSWSGPLRLSSRSIEPAAFHDQPASPRSNTRRLGNPAVRLAAAIRAQTDVEPGYLKGYVPRHADDTGSNRRRNSPTTHGRRGRAC